MVWATAVVFFDRIFLVVRAVTRRSRVVRPLRMCVRGRREKWSFDLVVTWSMPTPYIGHTHIHVRSVFTLLSPFPMPQVVVGDGGGFAREGQAVGGCAGAALCLRGQISASGTTDALKTVVLIGAMRAYLGPGPPRGGGRGPLIH